MDAADSNPPQSAKLHVSTLLVASERALSNALDELGFAQDDDRIIEHEGRLAFITCSHDPDCDDPYALISELAARGETWELQFRIDTGEGRAIFQRLARHQPVEAVDAQLPPEAASSAEELPVHELEADAGTAKLKKALGRIDPAEVFVTIGTTAVVPMVTNTSAGSIRSSAFFSLDLPESVSSKWTGSSSAEEAASGGRCASTASTG